MYPKHSLLSLALVFTLFTSAFGALRFEDSLDSGSNWSAASAFKNSGLSFGDLDVSGGAIGFGGEASFSTVDFSGSEVWVSFLMKANSFTDGQWRSMVIHFNDNFTSTSSPVNFMLEAGGDNTPGSPLGFTYARTHDWSKSIWENYAAVNVDATYFNVLRMVDAGGGNVDVYVWRVSNASVISTTPLSEGGVGYVGKTTIASSPSLSKVRLEGYNVDPIFDEFRVGDEYVDIVPGFTGGGNSGPGTLLAYEGFDGSINSGTGWSGSWVGADNSGDGEPIYSATGLTFSNLQVTGGTSSSGYTETYRAVNPIDLTTGSPVYLSFIYHLASGDGGYLSFTVNNHKTGAEQISYWRGGAGGPNKFNIMMRDDPWAGSIAIQDVDTGDKLFVVSKFQYDGAAIVITSWTYRNVADIPDAEPVSTHSYSMPVSAGYSLERVALSNAANTFAVDEIRIATGWQAVAPTFTVTQTPGQPTGLTATNRGHETLFLSWTTAADAEIYKIERSIDQSNWTEIGQVSGNTGSYEDYPLTEGTTYYYRVIATNSVGDSTPSSIASGVPMAVRSAITRTGPNKIVMIGDSITNGVGGTSGAGGYRKPLVDSLIADGYNFVTVGTKTDNSSLLSSSYNKHEGYPGDTIAALDSLIYGGAYGYPATNIDGNMIMDIEKPNIALVLLGTNNLQSSNYPDPAGANAGWSYDAVDLYGVLLRKLAASSPGITLFVGQIPEITGSFNNIWYNQPTSNFDDQFVTDVSGLVDELKAEGISIVYVDTRSSVSISGDGLHPNQSGYDVMAARWFSAIQAQTVTSVPSTPVDPTGLVVQPTLDQNIHLSWNDNGGMETLFSIERSVNGGSFAQIDTVATDVREYLDTTVALGNTYTYRVRAMNGSGYSAYTDSESATVYEPADGAIDKGQTVNIAFIGDSITWGVTPGSGGSLGSGYRVYLRDLLQSGGYTWASVGTKNGGNESSTSNGVLSAQHDENLGFPGLRTDHLHTLFLGGQFDLYFDDNVANLSNARLSYTTSGAPAGDTYLDVTDGIVGSSFDPEGTYALFRSGAGQNTDIICIMLGANDSRQGLAPVLPKDYGLTEPDQKAAAIMSNFYKPMIDLFLQQSPGVHILVASATKSTENRETEIGAYNTALARMIIDNYDQQKVYHVNMHDAIPTSQMPDGLHPGVDGYQTMAQVWYNAINSITIGASAGETYENWAATNSVTGLASDDGDNDGVANLIEYAFDMDPTSGEDVSMKLPILDMSGTTGKLGISFSVNNQKTDITYTVEEDTDPSFSSPTTVTTIIPNGSATVSDHMVNSLSNMSASQPIFMRVKITK